MFTPVKKRKPTQTIGKCSVSVLVSVFNFFYKKIKKLKSTDNVAFVIQKRFRQIEIVRPRFLLMNHDLVLDFTRRTVQYIDTV